MTEYEMADLAISQKAHIQNMTANFQSMIDSQGSITQQFMTVLFGYLAAAYFIGATLSRKQVWIFSILYLAWQVWTIVIHSLRGISVRITLDALREVSELGPTGKNITEVMPQIIQIAHIALLSAALAASLYFMWDIRRSKTE